MRSNRMKNIVSAYCQNRGINFDPYAFDVRAFEYDRTFDNLGRFYLNGREMPAETAAVSYGAFKDVLGHQFAALIHPWNVRPVLCYHDPFETFEEMRAEFGRTDTLRIRGTVAPGRVDLPDDHPMSTVSPFRDANGVRMLWNDVFRFVHDTFTHLTYDIDFTFAGEVNAFYAHAATMIDRSAAMHALLNETLLQTCAYVANGDAFAEQRIVDTVDVLESGILESA